MRHNSKIVVDNGIIIYAGQSSETKKHKHYAIQIGIVLQGDYKLYIEDKEYQDNHFIIHSNIPHKHISTNGVLLCILIDPTTDLGNTLINSYSAPYQSVSISEKALSELQKELLGNSQTIDNLEHKIFELLKLVPSPKTTDNRITQLIEKINLDNELDTDLDAMLEDIPLSKSRIRFLFKQQTGLSIQRYILWVKIKKAFSHIMQNKSLSDAAFLAGFADYSHLSRVVNQISGMTMKSFLKDSYFVQDS